MKRLWLAPRLTTTLSGSWINFFPSENDTWALVKKVSILQHFRIFITVEYSKNYIYMTVGKRHIYINPFLKYLQLNLLSSFNIYIILGC